MIIKIHKKRKQWQIYDNADDVVIDHEPREFRSRTDFQEIVGDERAFGSVILKNGDFDSAGNSPIRAYVIEFSRKNKPHVVVFDTRAYICNDDGRTFERFDEI